MINEELIPTPVKIIKSASEHVTLPNFVTFSVNENGNCSLLFQLSSLESGDLSVKYNFPLDRIKKILTPNEKQIKVAGNDRAAVEILEVLTRLYLINFFRTFPFEIENLFNNLWQIPELLKNAPINKEVDNSKTLMVRRRILRRNLGESRKRQTEELLKHFFYNETILHDPTLRNKNVIAYFYDQLLPKWRQAVQFYEQNKIYGRWREMLSMAFGPIFPKDLIERLSDPDPYVSMASSLAIEHAARQCHIPPDSLSRRCLQNYLKMSKEWMDKNSGSEKDELIHVIKIQNMWRRKLESYNLSDKPSFNVFDIVGDIDQCDVEMPYIDWDQLSELKTTGVLRNFLLAAD